MKKKLVTFLTATAMILSLTACGNAENSSKDEQIEEMQQQVTVPETEDAQEEEQTAETETVTEELQQPEQEEEPNETQPELNSENEQLITKAADINDSNAEDQGTCGDDLRWYFANNILVIRGTGEMTECPWQENHIDDIYSVVIEDGCTSICNGAFEDSVWVGDEIVYHSNINSVILPDTLVTIGENAFNCCSNLTDITLPDSVTTIGVSAFNSTGITSFTIPASMTCLSGLNATAITSIDIPNGVTKIGNSAFFYCTNLTSVTIPDSVTEIDSWAFVGCENLANVTIPNADVIIAPVAFSEGIKVTIGDTEIEWDEEASVDGWNWNN